MTTYSLAILLISILFCIISTVLAIMLKRSNNNQEKLLAQMRTALEARQDNTENQNEQKDSCQTVNIFDDNLRTAELTTRLQHPRLTVQHCGSSPTTPERYCYIQSMVEKGMNTEEIASMLSMSLHETTQLVTLIKMARQPQPCNKEHLPLQEIAGSQDIQPATLTQSGRQDNKKQTPAPKQSGAINKSIKLARWLKGRAISPYLRKQSSREPPPHPLPRDQGTPYLPVPTGYT
jgi:hypothetical protein